MPHKQRYTSRYPDPAGCASTLVSLVLLLPSTKKQVHALRVLMPTNAEKPSELHPHELEQLAFYVYSKLGYRNVKHTGAHSTTDGGVDVWMLSKDGDVEIVQCKQLQVRVDRSELIWFAKTMRQQHAEKGHYWAPNGFTQPAIDYAEQNNIVLLNDFAIRNLLTQVVPDQAVEANRTMTKQYSQTKRGMTTTQIAVLFILGITVMCTALCVLWTFGDALLNLLS